MTDIERLRSLLAEADRCRAVARGADSAIVSMRVGSKIVVEKRTGRFGFQRHSRSDEAPTFKPLPMEVQDALYAALLKVRNENDSLAADYEAEATSKEKP